MRLARWRLTSARARSMPSRTARTSGRHPLASRTISSSGGGSGAIGRSPPRGTRSTVCPGGTPSSKPSVSWASSKASAASSPVSFAFSSAKPSSRISSAALRRPTTSEAGSAAASRASSSRSVSARRTAASEASRSIRVDWRLTKALLTLSIWRRTTSWNCASSAVFAIRATTVRACRFRETSSG